MGSGAPGVAKGGEECCYAFSHPTAEAHLQRVSAPSMSAARMACRAEPHGGACNKHPYGLHFKPCSNRQGSGAEAVRVRQPVRGSPSKGGITWARAAVRWSLLVTRLASAGHEGHSRACPINFLGQSSSLLHSLLGESQRSRWAYTVHPNRATGTFWLVKLAQTRGGKSNQLLWSARGG